ncbi:MAG: EamA family transporter [bacterium]
MAGERSTLTGTALAVTSVASVQTGAALAALLFPRVGPVGTVSLRLLGAALVLTALTRPWRQRLTRADLGTSAVFGAVFVGMNVSLYVAIDRLPLATGITLEFLGPLAVAVGTARSWRERIWALPAAVGVALLGGSLHAGDLFGVGAALIAAGCWASYILLSRRLGRGPSGMAGLTLASATGALVMLPIGAAAAGSALWRPDTLALGLLVGVVSSALPYSFDLLALRRLPTAVFGVLTSLNPAAAALAGLIVLGQAVPPRELIGIAAVIVAGVGVTASARRSARRPAQGPSGEDVGVDVEDALASAGPGV